MQVEVQNEKLLINNHFGVVNLEETSKEESHSVSHSVIHSASPPDPIPSNPADINSYSAITVTKRFSIFITRRVVCSGNIPRPTKREKQNGWRRTTTKMCAHTSWSCMKSSNSCNPLWIYEGSYHANLSLRLNGRICYAICFVASSSSAAIQFLHSPHTHHITSQPPTDPQSDRWLAGAADMRTNSVS